MIAKQEKMREKEKEAAKRVNLHEVIPLETPFIVQFTPTSYCNFKCNYCWQSLPAEVLGQKYTKQTMDFELYKAAIDGLDRFEQKIKLVLLAGLGEPLLHPQIDKMVAYAKQSGMVERVDILTNASLLTNEMSDKLIAAGLDRLRISLQGLSSDQYKKVCGATLDFDKLVSNIKYFYENRTETSMYLKIIDSALKEGEQEGYKSIFGKISDVCEIEFTCPFTKEIDYSAIIDKMKGTFRPNGDMQGSRACPLSFYMAGIHPNGDVCPWCTADIATVFGNIKERDLADIWHSKEVRDFWILQLKDRSQNKVCAQCRVPDFNVRMGDSLNGFEETLLEKLGQPQQQLSNTP